MTTQTGDDKIDVLCIQHIKCTNVYCYSHISLSIIIDPWMYTKLLNMIKKTKLSQMKAKLFLFVIFFYYFQFVSFYI